MARVFNGTTEFLRIASVLGLIEPFSCFAQIAINDGTVNQTLVALSDGASDAHYMIFREAADRLGAASNDQGVASGEAVSAGAVAAGWTGSYATWVSASDRRIRCENTTGQNLTTVTPDSLSEINVARYNASIGSYSSATFASLAFWSAVLSTDDQLALVQGFSPRRIRPQSLVFYAPLIRDVQDIRGAAAFATATGSVANHYPAYGY